MATKSTTPATPVAPTASEVEKPKRKKTCLVVFLVILGIFVILVLIGIFILAWFGFVPGLSDLFGANKPKDLGVKITQADYKPAIDKTGVKLAALPAGTTADQSIQYAGQTTFNTSFSSEDLSALVTYRDWVYTLVSNCQIKINADGTMESSGNLNLNQAENWAKAYGVSQDQVSTAKTFLGLISQQPAYYIKVKGGVESGVFNVDVLEAQIGRFSLPTGWFSSYKTEIENFAEQRVSAVPNMYIRSAKAVSGLLKVDVDMPATISTLNK